MKHSSNKKLFSIVIIFCFIGHFTYSQKTEINLNVYTGLFSFRGQGSTSTSQINFNPLLSPYNYTTNPYGKKPGFSYSFEAQVQRITKKKDVYGIGISFETLTSKVNVDKLIQHGFVLNQYPATGKTTLKNTFITLNPYVGHRYTCSKMLFDLSIGFDAGFCFKSHEVGEASANSIKYSLEVDYNRSKPSVDFRPRIQIKTQYKKIGLLLGYSLGLTNYQIEGNDKAYTSFVRIGIGYTIR